MMDNKARCRNADLKAMQTNDALLQEAVAIYNKQLREAEYEKWLATDAVVLNALRQGNVEQMKIKRVQADENAPTHIELSTRNVLVDLVELNNFSVVSQYLCFRAVDSQNRKPDENPDGTYLQGY